jgi:hypothetical protein
MTQDSRIKCIISNCPEYSLRYRCYTNHYEFCELFPQNLKEANEFEERFNLKGQTLEDNLGRGE